MIINFTNVKKERVLNNIGRLYPNHRFIRLQIKFYRDRVWTSEEVINFQCPSDITSTVSPVTLIAV